MPGDLNRRILQFPDAPKTPSIIVQILNHKDNGRADEVAAELAERIAELVPRLVLDKMTNPAQIRLEV